MSESLSSARLVRTSLTSLPANAPLFFCASRRPAVLLPLIGYIGKAVVREAVRRGYPTTAVVRDATRATSEPKFAGASVVQADVCVPSSLGSAGAPFEKGAVDVVISCLASRTGSKKDSYAIDYEATLNCLEAARAAGARHFVLLSAFCVKSAERKDPYALQFQYAKKDMEEALRAQVRARQDARRQAVRFKECQRSPPPPASPPPSLPRCS